MIQGCGYGVMLVVTVRGVDVAVGGIEETLAVEVEAIAIHAVGEGDNLYVR
jgi:hypothetical protein